MLLKNPDLPIFVLSEMRDGPDRLADVFFKHGNFPLEILEDQLNKAHEAGHIKSTSVYTFLMNLMSLTIFPFIVAPAMESLFKLDKNEFRKMIMERRKALPEMIINTFKSTL